MKLFFFDLEYSRPYESFSNSGFKLVTLKPRETTVSLTSNFELEAINEPA